MRYATKLFAATTIWMAVASPPALLAESLGAALAKPCAVCHGKNGLSKDPEAPNLAGQPKFYLEKSLTDYKTGARQDRRMSLIAKPLSKAEIKALAAYFAKKSIMLK